jgi:hypothetical protein
MRRLPLTPEVLLAVGYIAFGHGQLVEKLCSVHAGW